MSAVAPQRWDRWSISKRVASGAAMLLVMQSFGSASPSPDLQPAVSLRGTISSERRAAQYSVQRNGRVLLNLTIEESKIVSFTLNDEETATIEETKLDIIDVYPFKREMSIKVNGVVLSPSAFTVTKNDGNNGTTVQFFQAIGDTDEVSFDI